MEALPQAPSRLNLEGGLASLGSTATYDPALIAREVWARWNP